MSDGIRCFMSMSMILSDEEWTALDEQDRENNEIVETSTCDRCGRTIILDDAGDGSEFDEGTLCDECYVLLCWAADEEAQ